MKQKRGFLGYFLVVTFFVMGAWGWLRFWQAVTRYDWLQTLEMSVSPLYLAASGIVWLAVSAVIFIGLWLRKRWVRPAGIGAAFFMAASYWADRLLLTVSETSRANMPYALILTVLILFCVTATLLLPESKRLYNQG